MSLALALGLLALSGCVYSHGGVREYRILNESYPGYVWHEPFEGQSDLIQRAWHQNPITSPSAAVLACNIDGAAVPGSYHAPVTAGDTITVTWHDGSGFGWPHTVGPIVAYMASCGGDCVNVTDLTALQWFKIAEEGLREGFALGELDGWLQYDIWENRIGDSWDVVVPRNLKPGKYMIRHEIIMLELNPVQFYPQCAHLDVAGEGTALPTEEDTVTFPGGYSLSDPGIAISGRVRNDLVTRVYEIPGPKVWTGE